MTRAAKPYSPRGKILLLIAAMEAEPDRIWLVPEAGKVMDVRSGGVIAAVTYALKNKLMFRGLVKGRAALSLKPFDTPLEVPQGKRYVKYADRQRAADNWLTDPEDVRIQRVVPGWLPPQMSAPRG